MQEGQIVMVFEKKGRGYFKSVQLATVKTVVGPHTVILFDGRRFEATAKEPARYLNHDLKYKTSMRAPFSWETYIDYVQIRGMV